MAHSQHGRHICRVCYASFGTHVGWSVHLRRVHDMGHTWLTVECEPDCGSRAVYKAAYVDRYGVLQDGAWVPYAER